MSSTLESAPSPATASDFAPPVASNATSTTAPERTHSSSNASIMSPSQPPRTSGSRLFSPRSTAALALSSISQPLRTEAANDTENNQNSNNNNANINMANTEQSEKNSIFIAPKPSFEAPVDAPTYAPPPPMYHDPYGNGPPSSSYDQQPPYHLPQPHGGQQIYHREEQRKKSNSPSMEHIMSGGYSSQQHQPSGGQSNNRWGYSSQPMPPPPPSSGGYYMMHAPPPPPPPPQQQGRHHHPSYQYAPAPYGHMPVDPRMAPHFPPPPPPMMAPTNKPFHERTWASLTPDGKRLKPTKDDSSYNRKLKSLGVLAEAFVGKHNDLPSNTSVVVDDMARMLCVERRRIYDVVNILESVGVVIKKSKNTYVWMGTDVMVSNLGELQEEAISRYPDDALEAGLITEEECAKYKASPPPTESIHHKTLNRLTQQFLHVFLVGHKTMSLPEASDKIHGSTSTMMELAKLGGWDGSDDGTGLAMHKAAAKGLKTKIRRLYDVSNVLFHLNWIVKLSPAISQPKLQNDIAPLLLERRPQYKWNYEMSPKQIRATYLQAKSRHEYREAQTISSYHSHHHHHAMTTAAAPVSTTSSHYHDHHHGMTQRRVSLEDEQRPSIMMDSSQHGRRISLDHGLGGDVM